jgi:C-terminal processing protease CtpA/Prc
MLRALATFALVVAAGAEAEAQAPFELGTGGVGMVIGYRDSYLVVIRVIPGMAAERAGIRDGDRIVRIDQTSTRRLMLVDAGSRLRGEPGTQVTVVIARERKPGRWSRGRALRIVREQLPEIPPGEL